MQIFSAYYLSEPTSHAEGNPSKLYHRNIYESYIDLSTLF